MITSAVPTFEFYVFYYKKGEEAPSYRSVTDEVTDSYLDYVARRVEFLKCEKAIVADERGKEIATIEVSE